MSLVSCRFNPNHKMKPSKREIHEQKCPDRFRCKIKYKYCPYDPLELIKEEDYEAHLLVCKSRPKITREEEEAIEQAKKLNDIATEKEQIKYAREKYYKGCVEEPEIPGLGKNAQKKNKKKQNKILKKKFEPIVKQEENHITAMVNHDPIYDDDTHDINDLSADLDFDLDNEKEEEKIEEHNAKKPNNKNKSEINENKNDLKNDNKNDNKKDNRNDIKNKKKDVEKKKNNNQNREKIFYKYDPNDEDKDIDKFCVNIIIPKQIYQITGEEE